MANRFLSNIKINDAYTFPASDGTNGQVIKTDGSGNLSFAQLAADSASVMYKDTFTGNGSATAFTLANALNDEVQSNVYIDGVYQSKSTYSVSGTTLTFSTAPASGHEIEVISTTGINSGPTAIYTDTFTANGSATAFTLGQTVHDENQTIVFLNGVYQFKGTYTLSGTTLTLDAAPANGVAIEVMSIGSAYSGGDILYDHDFGSAGLMTTNGSGVYSITANNSANWNTAYGWGDHSTQSYATQSYVGTQISNLVDSSPATLNTLNELAAALGDDPNFATTTANSIGTKLPLAGGTLTGNLQLNDNVKARFGAGNDLDIYSDGTVGYIKGDDVRLVNAAGENIFRVNGDTAELYYNDIKKFETTSTGVSVTGDIISSAIVQAKGFRTETGSTDYSLLTRNSTNTAVYIQQAGSGNIVDFRYGSQAAGQGTSAMLIDSSGNVGIGIAPVSGARLTLGTGSVANEILSFAPSTGGNAEFRNTSSTGTFTFTNANGSSERMRIDSSGNVAIQTSGADDIKNFTINSSNGSSQVAGFVIQNDGANGYIHFKAGAGNATPSTKLTIGNAANSGNVGIGVTSPGAVLDIYSPYDVTANPDSTGIRLRRVAGGSQSYLLGMGVSGVSNNFFAIRDITNSAYRFVITDSGNVGIGTASPGAQLHNYSTATTNVFITGHGTAAQNDWGAQNCMFVKTDNGLLISKANAANNTNRIFNFYNDSNGNAQFYMHASAAAASVKIQASGNSYFNGGSVGIGTTSPTTRLSVSDGAAMYADNNYLVQIKRNATNSNDNTSKSCILLANNSNAFQIAYGGTTDRLRFINGGGVEQMTLLNGGNVGIGRTDPNARLDIKGAGGGTGLTFETSDGSNNQTFYVQDGGKVGVRYYPFVIGADSSTTVSGLYNRLAVYNASTRVVSVNYQDSINTIMSHAGAPNYGLEALTIRGDYIAFYTDYDTSHYQGVERMRINASGNVGIGTDDGPGDVNAKLHIYKQSGDNTVNELLRLDCGENNHNVSKGGAIVFRDINVYTDTAKIIAQRIGNTGGSTLQFALRGSEAMRIQSGGQVLIGTDTTTVSSSVVSAVFGSGSEVTLKLGGHSGTHTMVQFFHGGTAVGSITSNTTSTSYNTSSDYRLKEDLQDFNGLDKVSKIPVYDFKWKADESRSYGVMAHELQEVLPDAVTGEKDAEEMQGVDYSKIVPLLVKSIQELKANNDSLKARIETLENN